MTIADLIHRLQQFPPETPVLLENPFGKGHLYAAVVQVQGVFVAVTPEGQIARFESPRLAERNTRHAVLIT
jgi:hypothetical protein